MGSIIIIAHDISIHAPPRGATCGRRSKRAHLHFNSRPSARGDVGANGGIPTPLVFQFTPLREGRQDAPEQDELEYYFNSRPSARGDAGAHSSFHHSLFQFTPLREGRPHPHSHIRTARIFQFTPLREGRRACRFLVFCGFPFQFTPLREGRRLSSAGIRNAHLFQFTPLREGRPYYNAQQTAMPISIHAPPRGATFNHGEGARIIYFNSRPSARGDAKDMQFLQIFCSTLTNQHGLTIVPRNLSRLFW